jgi:hypothetical protein
MQHCCTVHPLSPWTHTCQPQHHTTPTNTFPLFPSHSSVYRNKKREVRREEGRREEKKERRKRKEEDAPTLEPHLRSTLAATSTMPKLKMEAPSLLLPQAVMEVPKIDVLPQAFLV